MARVQGETTTEVAQHFAGIDVSKAYLDIRLTREKRSRRFSNDPAGFAALAAHLGPAPHLIVLEPTGRYHHAVWKALAAAGHGVAPVNPLHVRRFAESDGELAKHVPGPIGERTLWTLRCWPAWRLSGARRPRPLRARTSYGSRS